MVVQSGLVELILLFLLVAVVPALAVGFLMWQRYRRRIGRLQADLAGRRQGEFAAVIREFKHQATHALRPMKDALAWIRQELGNLPAEHQPLRQSVEGSLRTVEIYEWRLTRLIENLSLLSQLETPGDAYSFSQVNLEGVVDDVIKELQPVAEARRVDLNWWTGGEAAPRVTANDTGLHQVLANLVDNAIKYCPEGGTVDVILGSDPARDVVTLQVRDNGPGIPKEDLDLIFQKGYSVEKSRGRPAREGGQGLGLCIVRLIVERHHGHVAAASTLGQGTTFTVTLPVRRI